MRKQEEFQSLSLGEKIKFLRKKQGLSREAFCAGEMNLSVRQLFNIEQKSATPTQETLKLIANKLSVKTTFLLEILPENYFTLKEALIRSANYREQSRKNNIAALFDQVEKEFEPLLDEEELEFLDLLKAIHQVQTTKKIHFGKKGLSRNLEDLLKEDDFTINELLYIQLHLINGSFKPLEQDNFDNIISKLLSLSMKAGRTKAYLVQNALFMTANLLVVQEDYPALEQVLSGIEALMRRNQDFLRLPLVRMLEGKCLLLYRNRQQEAQVKYEQGALLAEGHGDLELASKIRAEFERDLLVQPPSF